MNDYSDNEVHGYSLLVDDESNESDDTASRGGEIDVNKPNSPNKKSPFEVMKSRSSRRATSHYVIWTPSAKPVTRRPPVRSTWPSTWRCSSRISTRSDDDVGFQWNLQFGGFRRRLQWWIHAARQTPADQGNSVQKRRTGSKWVMSIYFVVFVVSDLIHTRLSAVFCSHLDSSAILCGTLRLVDSSSSATYACCSRFTFSRHWWRPRTWSISSLLTVNGYCHSEPLPSYTQ